MKLEQIQMPFVYYGKKWNGKKYPFAKLPMVMIISELLSKLRDKHYWTVSTIQMATHYRIKWQSLFPICKLAFFAISSFAIIYISVQPWNIFGTLLQLNEWSLTLKMERCRGKMHLKKNREALNSTKEAWSVLYCHAWKLLYFPSTLNTDPGWFHVHLDPGWFHVHLFEFPFMF